MELLADWIWRALAGRDDAPLLHSIASDVERFCLRFPVPGLPGGAEPHPGA